MEEAHQHRCSIGTTVNLAIRASWNTIVTRSLELTRQNVNLAVAYGVCPIRRVSPGAYTEELPLRYVLLALTATPKLIVTRSLLQLSGRVKIEDACGAQRLNLGYHFVLIRLYFRRYARYPMGLHSFRDAIWLNISWLKILESRLLTQPTLMLVLDIL